MPWYGVTLATTVAAYVLVGIDEVGIEIENVFLLLPFQQISAACQNDVRDQFVADLPPPPPPPPVSPLLERMRTGGVARGKADYALQRKIIQSESHASLGHCSARCQVFCFKWQNGCSNHPTQATSICFSYQHSQIHINAAFTEIFIIERIQKDLGQIQ